MTMAEGGGGGINPVLTLKALIAVIFVLIGLQYLSLLQVQDTSRFWRQSGHPQQRGSQQRSLIYIESLATNCLEQSSSASGSVVGHCFLNNIALPLTPPDDITDEAHLVSTPHQGESFS